MTMTTKRVGLTGALLSLALAAGCVATEPTGVDPRVQKTFTGFASNPGATVELYAFSRLTNAWETLPDTTTTSSIIPTTLAGRTVYSWTMQSTLLEVATDWCRVGGNCSSSSEGPLRIQFREIDGDFSPLLTFDDGGFDCMISAASGGEDLFVAAWGCKAQIFDELRFYIIQ